MARVLCVIGARLNSSRLPGKHLLDLAGRPLIARLVERLERVPAIDDIVLATTADDYNRPLVAWCETEGQSCFAYTGDVNDLVGRVDAVVGQYAPDILVYCCGDSPLIEPATLQRLIEAMQAAPGVERAVIQADASGRPPIHEGFDLYSRSLWKRAVQASTRPEHREHVGSVLREWREPLQVTEVEENAVFHRIQHRLSVDTVSDYRFMSRVYDDWYADNPEHSIVSLPWLIGRMESEPELRAINRSVRQRTVGETAGKALLVTCAGPEAGLGHLSRSVVMARLLQDRLGYGVRLAVLGPEEVLQEPLPADFFSDIDSLLETVTAVDYQVLVMDWPWQQQPFSPQVLAQLTGRAGCSLGIDMPPEWQRHVDIVYLPACAVRHQEAYDPEKLVYGWDSYLFHAPARRREWRDRDELLVLTGGSDPQGLADILPALLDAALPDGMRIRWVQGPFAPAPRLIDHSRLDWHIVRSPAGLEALFDRARLVVSVFGISTIEALRAGLPTVVYSPYGDRDKEQLQSLEQAGVAEVAWQTDDIADRITRLWREPELAGKRADVAWERLQRANGDRFVAVVQRCGEQT